MVSRKGRSLGVGAAVHQVSNVIGLVQQDGLREVLPMHHGGIVIWPVGSGAKPRHALLYCHSLWDREGPVHGVQLRVSVYSAVVTDICPKKETSVCGEVPFLFLLQELELHGSILLDRCSQDAAVAGWNAAVCLNFRGVGAVVCREVISGFDHAISIVEGEAVGHGDRKEPNKRT